ncbi:MAG: ParB family chromosome partitioning protein [Bradymonadia bacterium]|jgi:ParB family chromosome partitioning protein
MSTKRAAGSRLGRGLNTLLSDAPTTAVDGDVYFQCDVGAIEPMPGQPRRRFEPDALKELSESIKVSGVLQPMVVRRREDGKFTLIAGERRLRASKLAGLLTVPIIVRDVTDREAFTLALVENLQREDLNPIEEALAFQRLIDEYEYTQEDVGEQLGKGRSTVTNGLRLLRLDSVVQNLVADGSLSAGHARAVLAAPEELQAEIAERIITEGWSVRKAEQAARTAKQGDDPLTPKATEPEQPESAQMRYVQRRLMEKFGTRVLIAQRAQGRGVIELHFADNDALQTLVDQLLE